MSVLEENQEKELQFYERGGCVYPSPPGYIEDIDQSKMKPFSVVFSYHGHTWTADVFALNKDDAWYMMEQMGKGRVRDLGFPSSIYSRCEHPCPQCQIDV